MGLIRSKSCFLLLCGLLPVLLLARPCEAGPIYVYKEADGVIRFSNRTPPAGKTAQVFQPGQNGFSIYKGLSNVPYNPRKLFKNEYSEHIKSAAARYQVGQDLIRAVIHVESGFNPRAVSPKGARGLMQLMRETQREVGVKDAFDASQNIDGGTRYLAMLLKKYNRDEKLALAAYNAGAGAVDKYGGIPPYAETQEYVRRVTRLHTRYKALPVTTNSKAVKR